MSQAAVVEAATTNSKSHSLQSRALPLVLLLFVASGCASLTYEVIWFQLLQLVIGSTAVSMAVLLATYMGGMCLGSLVVPRYVSRKIHPLHVYAGLELGIAVCGLAIAHGLPYVERIYTAGATSYTASLVLRGVVSIVCLLLPTVMMGATLPAVARWVESTPQGVSKLGFLYTGNVLGAVGGCLLAGFYLLRLFTMVHASHVAAEINLAAVAMAAACARFIPYDGAESAETALTRAREPHPWPVYITTALSGFTALGAEAIWTRLLSLTIGATVYTFSIILAVFLLGLSIGSAVGSALSRDATKAKQALGWCQILLTLCIAWAAYAISESLPYWPISPGMAMSPWYGFQLDLVRCAWAILPASIAWGASFPLALGAAASPGQDPGVLVSRIYAANTLGSIVGALAFTLVLIPSIGTQGSHRLLIVLSAVAALPVWWPLLRSSLGDSSSKDGEAPKSQLMVGFLAALLVFVVQFLARHVPPPSCAGVAFGRNSAEFMPTMAEGMYAESDVPTHRNGEPSRYCTFVGEGMNVSAAVTNTTDGWRFFHGAGKVQASSNPQDMRFQRMLGHLTALTQKGRNAESVLVVAMGAGVTAGSFVPYDSVKRIVICDIEPLVPAKVTPLFHKENYDIVNDPRTHLQFDDGRHFIRTTDEKFDVITSDPIDPWVKGCAALNTIEYYQMCRDHLKPGGVMALWMPLYESDLATTKSLISTFFKVFPHGIFWSNDLGGEGYDAVLFGSLEPLHVDVDELTHWLDEHPKVKDSLTEVGFGSKRGNAQNSVAIDLLATYAGRTSDMGGWMKDAQLNTDQNLRLQYLAGMSSNRHLRTQILNDILRYYKYPTDLFSGSPETMSALQQALRQRGRKD